MFKYPTVSVVIPVKNGFPEIKNCIQGILKQTVPVQEIIAIDSGSVDDTVKYLQTIPKVRLIQISASEFNHGGTRNIGWQQANSEFIVYTVQDAVATDENWLSELLKGFDDEFTVAVCGQQIVASDKKNNPVLWFKPLSKPQQKKYSLEAGEFDRLSPREKTKMCCWDNVCAVYRRSVLEKISFPLSVYGEDMAWAKKALLTGYTIIYNPAARVYHYHQEDADFTFKRSFTTMYFRYKQFGYLYDTPSLSFRNKLSIIKSLFRNLGPDIKSIIKWYRYNISNFNAFVHSHTLFMQILKESESALDHKHEELCGKPPIPLKVK